MTAALTRIDGPFALACTERAFDGSTLRLLGALFAGPRAWVRHQDAFYRCFIAEVDGELPDALLVGLRERVGDVLGLDLAGPVRVTAQRMEAHDGSDRHTDRPLAGYEAARLVVQLDRGVGGHFRAFAEERVWLDRAPEPNGAVAFELCVASEHDVTACTGTRRSVVFHFWHRANPIDARQTLDAQLGSLSFAELPAVLEPWMAAAESVHDEVLTHRAASVATLLQRWGHPEAAVVAGYNAVIAGRPENEAEALARFLVGLHVDHFDRSAWERLPVSAQAKWLAAQTDLGGAAAKNSAISFVP